MAEVPYEWISIGGVPPKSFICGYCGQYVSSEKGYQGRNAHTGKVDAGVWVCHNCHKPTFFNNRDGQFPGARFGAEVQHISDNDVQAMYNEARSCAGAAAHTAAILCCRKLLMHIAVQKGAPEGKSFAEYVQHLVQKNIVPAGSVDWVDEIRKKGNEANHEIKIMTKEEAEELISFCEMLLKLIYEFPARVVKRP